MTTKYHFEVTLSWAPGICELRSPYGRDTFDECWEEAKAWAYNSLEYPQDPVSIRIVRLIDGVREPRIPVVKAPPIDNGRLMRLKELLAAIDMKGNGCKELDHALNLVEHLTEPDDGDAVGAMMGRNV